MTLVVGSPALTFYSQRVDPSPYCDSLPYAACTALGWSGYVVPSTYGKTLRRLSGVDCPGVLTLASVRRAIRKDTPDAPYTTGDMSDDFLWNILAPNAGASGNVVNVIVKMNWLSDHLRRWVGQSYKGKHAITLGLGRLNGGVRQVWWMDPMGTPSSGYAGEWANWSDVVPAFVSHTPAMGSGKYPDSPLFSREGPRYYAAAFQHNSPFATGGPYQTSLNNTQEKNFKAWVAANGVPFDVSASTVDYDMRGYWLATGGTWDGGHFPDTYKTPYDTSFSADSHFATGTCPFSWTGESLRDSRNGAFVFSPPKFEFGYMLRGSAR